MTLPPPDLGSLDGGDEIPPLDMRDWYEFPATVREPTVAEALRSLRALALAIGKEEIDVSHVERGQLARFLAEHGYEHLVDPSFLPRGDA